LGASLAKAYCQVCHLFTDPGLLDKKTWENHTLPWMSSKMGLKKIDWEKYPGRQYLRQSNISPAVPMVTSNQWAAICKYYLAKAPAEPLPQGKRPPIQMDLEK